VSFYADRPKRAELFRESTVKSIGRLAGAYFRIIVIAVDNRANFRWKLQPASRRPGLTCITALKRSRFFPFEEMMNTINGQDEKINKVLL
jgi:hypothetical protein